MRNQHHANGHQSTTQHRDNNRTSNSEHIQSINKWNNRGLSAENEGREMTCMFNG